jgi:hypothetical protein
MKKRTYRASAVATVAKPPDMRGYLKKKSRQDRWQKRWFEVNDHYLTYYKVCACSAERRRG